MTDYQRGQQDIIDKLRIIIDGSIAMSTPDSTLELATVQKMLEQIEQQINDPFKEKQ